MEVLWWLPKHKKGRDRNSEKEEMETQKINCRKFHLSKMKHNQWRYCQCHKSNGNHYSSECNRYPANLKNSRITDKDYKRSSSISCSKPTSKLPTFKPPSKPEASKILNKIKPLFSSSGDEKEDTQELITLEGEEQKQLKFWEEIQKMKPKIHQIASKRKENQTLCKTKYICTTK